jgi:GT2 family glycosyltransferase
MSDARTTFVIPCWEARQHLRPLLESLLAQTRPAEALVLVDDASTDGTAELAREIAGDRVRIERNPRRLGIAGNWNRCTELVETPFFCIAHMDDVYDPRFLERMIPPLLASPDAGLAHCKATAIDEDGRPLQSAVESYKDRFFWPRLGAGTSKASLYQLLFHGNFVSCPTVVYRTRAFRATGPFERELSFALDWQHHFRMLLAGFGIASVPEALLRYRRHRHSTSAQNVRSLDRYREEAQVLRFAAERGRTAGLLTPGQRSRALRNNLLYDAWIDVRAGKTEAARAKLELARGEVREFAWDAPARVFDALHALGPPGRAALDLCMRAVLARSNRQSPPPKEAGS